MSTFDRHLNEHSLRKLDRNERYKLFGLTLPYLLMVLALTIIPVAVSYTHLTLPTTPYV